MSFVENQLQTNNWFDYQYFYEEISKINSWKTYVEVGVWKGHSLSYLVNALITNHTPNFKVYAVDLWQDIKREDGLFAEDIPFVYDIYNENLRRVNAREYVSDIRSLSWDGASKFADGSVDFCFIDADHHYESVLKDINSWFPKMKPGGLLAGHDYSIVKKDRYSVKEAVADFLKDKKNITLTVDSNESIWRIRIP